MNISKDITSNIWKLYLIRALRWFLLIMPIIVLFYQENGLSMRDILILQALFSLAVIIFEIPSGYFSDAIGRKPTIVLGCIFASIGLLIYSFSYGFIGFLFAEIMVGLGSSFLSGTDSALVYDSLMQANKEDEYKLIEGRLQSVSNFSEGIASIFGGMFALYSLRTPLIIETVLLFLSIPVALSLIEPERKKPQNRRNVIKEIVRITKYSLHDHREIKWLIFYSGITSASTLIAVWLIQPYFNEVDLPLKYFGIIWALLNFSVGIFTLFSHKYEEIMGRKFSLISLILISALAYLLLGIFKSIFAIVFIFLFYFVRGMSGPILKDYVNKIIDSDIRATVLSIRNLVGRFFFAIFGPYIGWISDVYSLQTALSVSGVTVLVLGLSAILFLHINRAL